MSAYNYQRPVEFPTETVEDDGQVHCIMVLDASGSMSSNKDHTRREVNEVIRQQREATSEEGEPPLPPLFFTFVTFADFSQLRRDRQPVEKMLELGSTDYDPDGSTALYEAIGNVLTRYAKLQRVVVFIVTDGEENSSVTYNREQVFKLITQARKRGWNFRFLGANQDSWKIGQKLGLAEASCTNFVANAAGISGLCRGVSSEISGLRTQYSQNH
jgi:hypothetical protein